jgi:hypothetical protein
MKLFLDASILVEACLAQSPKFTVPGHASLSHFQAVI